MTARDIDAVLAIEKTSFIKPWCRTSFLEELSCKNSCNYILFNDYGVDNCCKKKQIVAYICFRLIVNEMHILKIAVAQQWRNQGIASRLLDSALGSAVKNKAASALLEVRTSNAPAIMFYTKFGFQRIGRRPNYYSPDHYLNNREDALIMMKNLKER
jgi:ribosomal-protein-alanine N-acetyltransferase